MERSVKLMLEERIGIKEIPVVRQRLDEGFFDSLNPCLGLTSVSF